MTVNRHCRDVACNVFEYSTSAVKQQIALQTFTHWNKTAGFEAKRIP